jgi:hypothetical protein
MKNVEEAYWKLAEIEQRFNTTQAATRALASTWMLAAFSAIAFLIRSQNGGTWLMPPLMLVVLVSTMAVIGLFVLWIVDQLVYQRLLGAAFTAGLRMEYDNPCIPPIRALMMHSAEGVGMSRWLLLYYLVPMIVFLMLSSSATWIFVTQQSSTTGAPSTVPTISMIAMCLAEAALMIVLYFKSKSMRIGELAKLFRQGEFTDLFSGTKFDAGGIVSKYDQFWHEESERAVPKGTSTD